MSLNIALDFQIAADKYRDQTAIIYHGLHLSYGELANSIRYWAIILSRMGVQRGDHVAMVLPNVPEFTITYFAVLHLGGVVVPMNTLLTSTELTTLLAHSDAKFIVAYHGCADRCVTAFRNVDNCQALIITGTAESGRRFLPDLPESDDIFWMDDEIAKLGDSSELADAQHSTLPPATLVTEHEDILDWHVLPYDDLAQAPWPIGYSQMDVGVGVVPEVTSVQTHIPVGISSETILTGRERFENTPEWENLLTSDGRMGFAWSPAPVPTDPNDTAVILYTSGTTGTPKGVQLTHFNLYSNAMFVRECLADYRPGKRAIAILPLFHTFGQTYVQNAVLFSGATVVMVPRFEPKKVLRIITEEKIGVIAAVPTMLIHLLHLQQKQQLELPALYQIISGGSPLSCDTYHALSEAFPTTRVLDGYGLSETSPLATCQLPSDPVRVGSIGREIAGSQVRVMREDHSFADPEEIGEIVIRGHNVMKGYYKDPLATEKAFVGSWFLTGDIGYYDEDGYLFLKNRKKDIIIRAGMNIYPQETEDVLQAHPAVKEVVVVGVPHAVHGEDVVAFIVRRDGMEVAEMDLQRYCSDRLAAYKCPQRFVFVDSMPTGCTGKVLKQELRKMLV